MQKGHTPTGEAKSGQQSAVSSQLSAVSYQRSAVSAIRPADRTSPITTPITYLAIVNIPQRM